MKLLVCSVYDKAVGAYLKPFFARSEGEARRSFADACNDPQMDFNKYSSDYLLVKMGEFDDNSGLFVTVDPVRLVSASECIVIGPDPGPVAPPAGDGAREVKGRRLPM